MIKYTKKTREILDFINTYGFITSKICGNIFYKNSKFPMEQARRKLKSLTNNKDIVANTMGFNKELIYQVSKNPISNLKYYIFNIYSRLYKFSDEILYVDFDNIFKNTNKHYDIHIVLKKNINDISTLIGLIIDFEKFHKINKDKYDVIYLNEGLKHFYKNNFNKEIFPDILIVNYSGKVSVNSSYNYKIKSCDYNFTDLESLLLG